MYLHCTYFSGAPGTTPRRADRLHLPPARRPEMYIHCTYVSGCLRDNLVALRPNEPNGCERAANARVR